MSHYLKYLNLRKSNKKLTSCVSTLKFWTDNEEKYMWFSLNFALKGALLPALKGSNSCKILENQSRKCAYSLLYRYSMFGRGICEYQSRDEKISEPNGEWNLVSRLVFFANTPPKHGISV